MARLFAWLRRLVLGLLGLLALLVLAVTLTLSFEGTRTAAVEWGLGFANDALEGRIEVGEVVSLSPWHLRLFDVRILDAEGHQVAHVSELEVKLAPVALARGTLRLRQVEAHDLRAQLGALDGPPDGVIGALQPEDTGAEQQESQPSRFTVRVDDLEVEQAEVLASYAGQTYQAQIPILKAHGRYGEATSAALEKLRMEVRSSGRRLLSLQTDQGSWDAAQGGHVKLSGQLVDSPLSIEAEVVGLEQQAAWPVESAHVQLQSVGPETLSAFGVRGRQYLSSQVSLTASAERQGKRLQVEADVRAAEGGLTASGSLTHSSVRVRLHVRPTRLAAVSPKLPQMRVRGTVRARARYGDDVSDYEGRVRWHDVRLDGSPIPDGKSRLAYSESRLRVKSMSLLDVRGQLQVSGHYDVESGDTEVRLRLRNLSLHSLRLPIQARGRVDARIDAALRHGERLDVSVQLSADQLQVSQVELRAVRTEASAEGRLGGQLQARLHVVFAELSAEALHTREGELRARVDGSLQHPEVELEAFVQHPSTPTMDAPLVSLDVQGDLQQAVAQVVVHGGERPWATMRVDARRDGETLQAQAQGRLRLQDEVWRVEVQRVVYASGVVEVRGLTARSGRQRVSGWGRLSESDRLQARLRVSNLRLEPVTDLAGITPVEGTLGARIHARGPVEGPNVEVDARLSGVTAADLEPVSGRLEAQLNVPDARAELAVALRPEASQAPQQSAGKPREIRLADDVDVDPEASLPPDTLRMRATTKWSTPGRFPDANALKHAHYSVELNANRVELAHLSLLAPQRLRTLRGTLTSEARLEGALAAPRGEGVLRLSLAQRQAAAAQQVRLEFHLSDRQSRVELVAREQTGVLLRLQAHLALDARERMRLAEAPAELLNNDFDVSMELNRTRIDELTGSYAHLLGLYSLDLPVRASAELRVQGRDGKITGDGTVKATVFNQAIDERCALAATSQLDATLALQKAQLTAELDASTHRSGDLHGSLQMPLDLRELLRKGTGVGAAKVSLDAREVALHQVPGLCELEGGTGSLRVQASGLGSERPSLRGELDVRSLRVRHEAGIDLHASLSTQARQVEAQGTLTVGGEQRGQFEVQLPVELGHVPELRPQAPLYAQLQLEHMPMAPLLVAVDAVGQVRGAISANVKVTGSIDRPRPKGWVELEQLGFSIASIAQPFRRITGRVLIDSRTLKLQNIEAHDHGGRLRIEGWAELHPDGGATAEVDLRTKDFPLRRQGTLVAEANTTLHAQALLSPDDQVNINIEIENGRLWLTGEQGGDVQSLEPMPEIRFASGEDQQQDEAELPVTLSSLSLETTEELWLQHRDFSVLVGCDIMLYPGPPTRMTGSVTMERGEMTLLGSAFVIEEGEISFTGATPPEPQLRIRAKHEIATGEDLYVHVTGRVSAPELSFSGAATTAGGALAAMTGVGAGEQASAAAQASDFAINMLAGLLSMTARRKYGEWVPLLAVETGAEGIERLRAGFDASHLIPNFLKGIAKGMYIEGIVGSGQAAPQDDTVGGIGVGVRAEVALPHDLVTTGAYGPGATWSVDVGWAP